MPSESDLTPKSNVHIDDTDITPSASTMNRMLQRPTTPTRASHGGSRRGVLLATAATEQETISGRDDHVVATRDTRGDAQHVQSSDIGSLPQTPPRPGSHSGAIQQPPPITPSNKGTSSISQSRADRYTIDAYVPYIEEDIMLNGHRVSVSFLDFLKFVLRSCAVEPVKDDGSELLEKVLDRTRAFCNGDSFKPAKKHLEEYCNLKRTTEEDGYPDFGKCINELLTQLRVLSIPELKGQSSLRPVFHRNDPKELYHEYDLIDHGKPQGRKPDFIMVTEELLESRKSLDESPSFKWPEILTTWELKCRGAGVEFPPPPALYPSKYTPDIYVPLPDGRITGGTKVVGSQHYRAKEKLPAVPESDLSHETLSPSTSTSRLSSSTNSTVPKSNSRKRSADDSDKATSSQKKLKMSLTAVPKSKPNTQNAMYGSEMLCRGIFTKHSINILIVDDVLWVWWFDRRNAIQTCGFNFVQDTPFLVAMLAAFQRFDLAQWGIVPGLVSPSVFTEIDGYKRPTEIVFENGANATVQYTDRLSLPGPVIKGRATCIIPVKSSSSHDAEGGLVIKAYWPEITRLNEADIINAARKSLNTSSDASDKELVKNLPGLIASRDFAESDTDIILEEFYVAPAPEDSNPRILRILLFRRLYSFEEIDEVKFMKGWLDCFKCHYALWQKGFEHGDISVWNLMWDQMEECGILNDWDLARVRGGIDKGDGKVLHGVGGQRTGTLPFMARDLLRDVDVIRLFRHEFESFVWVYTWVCLMDTHPERLRSWRVGTIETIRSGKSDMVSSGYTLYSSVKMNAWKKGKLLLGMLQDIDLALAIGEEHGVPTEPSPEEIYEEVLKLMTNDKYSRLNIRFSLNARASAINLLAQP